MEQLYKPGTPWSELRKKMNFLTLYVPLFLAITSKLVHSSSLTVSCTMTGTTIFTSFVQYEAQLVLNNSISIWKCGRRHLVSERSRNMDNYKTCIVDIPISFRSQTVEALEKFKPESFSSADDFKDALIDFADEGCTFLKTQCSGSTRNTITVTGGNFDDPCFNVKGKKHNKKTTKPSSKSKSNSSLMMWIIISVVVLFLIAAGGAAVYYFMYRKPADITDSVESQKQTSTTVETLTFDNYQDQPIAQ